jgi:hypothetical protein
LDSVRLLAADPELCAAIPDAARREAALAAVRAPGLRLAAGDVLDSSAIGDDGVGILVLSGFLTRETAIGSRVTAELIGPEDVLGAQLGGAPSWLVRPALTLSALTPARIAILDAEFRHAVAGWPEIGFALVERAGRPGDRAATERAIRSLPTIDARLLMTLWHWASTWSVVTPSGARLEVPLSQERLARLIGARRPTVSSAVGRLRGAGHLEQHRDGTWLLFGQVADADTGPLGELTDVISANGARARASSVRAAPRPGNGEVVPVIADLRLRLTEQRERLRLASARHQRELERLQERSERLRVASKRSALLRAGDSAPDEQPRLDRASAT